MSRCKESLHRRNLERCPCLRGDPVMQPDAVRESSVCSWDDWFIVIGCFLGIYLIVPQLLKQVSAISFFPFLIWDSFVVITSTVAHCLPKQGFVCIARPNEGAEGRMDRELWDTVQELLLSQRLLLFARITGGIHAYTWVSETRKIRRMSQCLSPSKLPPRYSCSALCGGPRFSDVDKPAMDCCTCVGHSVTMGNSRRIYIYGLCRNFVCAFPLLCFPSACDCPRKGMCTSPLPLPTRVMKRCDTAVVTIFAFLEQTHAFVFCLFIIVFFVPPPIPRPS